MILSFFGRKPPPQPIDLHDAIVAAARHPALYAEIGVPDVMQGRFEMLVLHVFLFMRRTKERPALADITQEVVDRVFLELDRALREQGVGDVSVPRKMKKMAAIFYGHVAAYATALDAGDRPALEAALRRIVFAEFTGEGDAGRLAAHVIAAEAHLRAAVSDEDILAGRLSFPAP